MSNIIVTGGSGTLGQALQKIMPDAYYLKSSDYDLTNQDAVKRMFDEFEPGIVIHCAAKVGGIIDNLNHPEQYFEQNIMMDTLMMRFAIANQVNQFIGILSTCAYPDVADHYPMTEDMLHAGPPAKSNFSYGIAKRAMAVHIDASNEQYGTKYQYLIPCNLYSGKHLEDTNKAHFLDTLIEKIRKAKELGFTNINLMGTGIAKRQFMHVDDLARVIKMTVEQGVSDSFNVCPDENYSIREIVGIALKAFDAEYLQVKWDPSMPDGQLNKEADNGRLKRLFPYFRFTPLNEGLKELAKK